MMLGLGFRSLFLSTMGLQLTQVITLRYPSMAKSERAKQYPSML